MISDDQRGEAVKFLRERKCLKADCRECHQMSKTLLDDETALCALSDRWKCLADLIDLPISNEERREAESKPKLKPCPFCGGEAYMVDAEIDGREHYIAKCGTCYSTSGVMQLSRPEAVAAWNHRAERTCRMVEVETGELADYSDTDEVIFHCESCHAERGIFSYDEDGNVFSQRPEYCPACGARVVE